MTFPTSAITTDNLSSGSSDPSLARADLLLAVQHINTIVSEANGAGGVAVLDGSARIASTRLPSTYSPSENLTLAPSTGVVKIQNVLRLQQLTTDQVLLLADSTDGDVVYVTDGDSGDPCLAVYANSNWNVLTFNQGTISKTVAATITSSSSIIAIPD
jgi:hypothetical protein